MDEIPLEEDRLDREPMSDDVEEPLQHVGMTDNVCLGGKVTKEILELGSGWRMPGNQF